MRRGILQLNLIFTCLTGDLILFIGFQKMVLRLLTEICDSVQQVGKRSEPADSDFHLVQMTNMEEFSELEENLLDIEKKKILVSRFENILRVVFISRFWATEICVCSI